MARRYQITVNGKLHQVDLLSRSYDSIAFVIDGESYQVSIEAPILSSPSPTSSIHQTAAPAIKEKQLVAAGSIVAPMPGIISKVICKGGDTVNKGDTLLVIEAMKMENSIIAPISGTIKKIAVAIGDEIKKNQILAIIE